MIEVSRQGDVAVLRWRTARPMRSMSNSVTRWRWRSTSIGAGAARAVIVTGTGSIFSAGVDLVRISAEGEGYVRRFLPALHRMFEAAFNLPKPLVAAVNGHAMAGGCVLACCADMRIAARGNGRIGITEMLVGVPFPALAFEVMRLCGEGAVPCRHDADRRDLSGRRGARARSRRRGRGAGRTDGSRHGRGEAAGRAAARDVRGHQGADASAGQPTTWRSTARASMPASSRSGRRRRRCATSARSSRRRSRRPKAARLQPPDRGRR